MIFYSYYYGMALRLFLYSNIYDFFLKEILQNENVKVELNRLAGRFTDAVEKLKHAMVSPVHFAILCLYSTRIYEYSYIFINP